VQVSKEYNFFDDLLNQVDPSEALKQQTDMEEKGKHLDHLIHKVFAQSDEGKELLEIWKESLIMSATADDGMDMIGVGIREGQKRMIRGIVLTIRRVEGE
jgi:hypothetical protein